MKQINTLLEKFKKLIALDDENKKTITETIKRFTKENIPQKDLKIQGKTLYIRQNPYVKKEISLKKKDILKNLKNSLVGLVIEDIK